MTTPSPGTDPGMPSRRSLLKGTALAPLGALMSASVLAASPQRKGLPTTDPHPLWLEEWRRSEEAWGAALKRYGDDSPEAHSLWSHRTNLADLLAATPAATVAGALAQLLYVMEEGNDEWEYVGHKEAVTSAIATLRRLV